MHHHGVTFSFAKVCSPAIFETCFSYDKDLWIATTGYYMYFYVYNCVLSINSYTPINKFDSFVIFSLLINSVILLNNYLALILYIHFPSLRRYFST